MSSHAGRTASSTPFALRSKWSRTKAKAAALKALELDPLLAEAHASLGMVKTLYEWDWAGGENEIREALRLNPSYETVYGWYATVLDGTERHEEVIASSRHAPELDPLP
jgi:hypothetical protein